MLPRSDLRYHMNNLLILALLSINLICGSEWEESEFTGTVILSGIIDGEYASDNRDDAGIIQVSEKFLSQETSQPQVNNKFLSRQTSSPSHTHLISSSERPSNGSKMLFSDANAFFFDQTPGTDNPVSRETKRKGKNGKSILTKRELEDTRETASLIPKLNGINIALSNATIQSDAMSPSDSEGASTPSSVISSTYSGYNSRDRLNRAPGCSGPDGVEIPSESDRGGDSEIGSDSENEIGHWKKRKTEGSF